MLLCWQGMALYAQYVQLVNRTLKVLKEVRNLHKINETWVHPHVITHVLLKYGIVLNTGLLRAGCVVKSHGPASHTLHHKESKCL